MSEKPESDEFEDEEADEPVVGDADAGPDPGGGFYYGSNISIGHINPSPGDLYYEPYTSLGQLNP